MRKRLPLHNAVMPLAALAWLIMALFTPLTAVDATPHRQTPAPDRPVVKGVMFWAEGCPHCDIVMQRTLPPLQKQYGDQLQIQLIEVSSLADIQRFQQVAGEAGVGRDRAYAPFLIIGDQVLIGSQEIPDRLPDLIERTLAAGGVDYPDLPSLTGLLSAPDPEAPALSSPEKSLAQPLAGTDSPALAGATNTEAAPANGFTLAIVIMVGMAAALLYVIVVVLRDATPKSARPKWLTWLTPLLALAGLGVAGYLTYVETQLVAAVCGPVGDCNAVQSSPYARLFGVLPVGLLGAIGYVGILIAWAAGRWGRGKMAGYAPLVLFGIAFFGVAFSLYLTYLEPFVIHAVCIWCITSAVIITLILLLNVAAPVKTRVVCLDGA